MLAIATELSTSLIVAISAEQKANSLCKSCARCKNTLIHGMSAPKNSLAQAERVMDREKFNSAIRAFKHRKPFRPFTVAMVDGDCLEIDHPDALAIRDGLGMFTAPGGMPVIFDNDGVSQVIGDLASQSSE